MKFLFDADVLLDLLLDRRPHARPAAELLSRVERSEISGCLCATAVTNIHYLAQKADGIVTRNGRDYRRATIPVHSPADAIALLDSAAGPN